MTLNNKASFFCLMVVLFSMSLGRQLQAQVSPESITSRLDFEINAPVDSELFHMQFIINPLAASNNDGSFFASPLGNGFSGNPDDFLNGTIFGSQRTDVLYTLIDDIYGQVGIDVQFLTPRTIQDSQVNVGDNAITQTPTFGQPGFVANRPFTDGGDAATETEYSIDQRLALNNRLNTTDNVNNLLTTQLLPGTTAGTYVIATFTEGGVGMVAGSEFWAAPSSDSFGSTLDIEAFVEGQTDLALLEPNASQNSVQSRLAQAFLIQELKTVSQWIWFMNGGGFSGGNDDNLTSILNDTFGPAEGFGLSGGGVLSEADLVADLFATGTQDDFIPINTAIWGGYDDSSASNSANWLSGSVPNDPRRPFVYNPFAAIFEVDPNNPIPDEIKTVDLLFVANPAESLDSQVDFGAGLSSGFHNVTIGQGVNGALMIGGRITIRNTTGTVIDTAANPDLFPGMLNDADIIIPAESTISHQGPDRVNFTGRILVDDFRYAVVGESGGDLTPQDTMNILNFDVSYVDPDTGIATGVLVVSGTIEDNSAFSPLATTQLVKQGPGTLQLTGTVTTGEDFIFQQGILAVGDDVFLPPAPIDLIVGAPVGPESRRLQATSQNANFGLDLNLSAGASLEVGGGTPINTTGLILDGDLILPAGTQLVKVGQNTVVLNSPGSLAATGLFVVDQGTLDATGAGAFPGLDMTVNGSSELLLGDAGIDDLALTGSNFLDEKTTFNGRTVLPAGTTLGEGTIIPAGTVIPGGTTLITGFVTIGDVSLVAGSILLVDTTLTDDLILDAGDTLELTTGATFNTEGLILPQGTELPFGTIVSNGGAFQFSTPAAGGGFLLSGGRLQPGGIETIGDAVVDSLVAEAGSVIIMDVAGGGLNDRVVSTALPIINANTQVFVLATPGQLNPVIGDAWDIVVSSGAGPITTPTFVTSPRWTLTPSNPSPEDLTVTLTDRTGFSDPIYRGRGIDPLYAAYLDALEADATLAGTLIPAIDAAAALDTTNPEARLVRIANSEADAIKGVAGLSQSEFARVSSFSFIQHLRSASRGIINEFTTPFEQVTGTFNSNEFNTAGLLASRRDDPQILAASLEEGSISAEASYIPAIRPSSSDSTFRGLSIIAEIYTVYGEGTRTIDTPAYQGNEYGILVATELGPFVFGENEDSAMAFGFALGYGGGDVSTGGTATNSEFNTVRLSPYVYGNIGKFAYLANFTVSNHELDLTRTSLSGFHYGNTDAYDISAYVEIGHSYPIRNSLTGPGWEIEPQAGILFQHYEQGAFNETGALPFNIGQFDQTTLSTRFGATVRSSLRQTLGLYTGVEGFLGWQHEYLDREFAVIYTDPTAVSGAARLSTPDRDKAYFGLNINLRLNENWSSFMRYEGNLGPNSHAHGLFGGLRFSQ